MKHRNLWKGFVTLHTEGKQCYLLVMQELLADLPSAWPFEVPVVDMLVTVAAFDISFGSTSERPITNLSFILTFKCAAITLFMSSKSPSAIHFYFHLVSILLWPRQSSGPLTFCIDSLIEGSRLVCNVLPLIRWHSQEIQKVWYSRP